MKGGIRFALVFVTVFWQELFPHTWKVRDISKRFWKLVESKLWKECMGKAILHISKYLLFVNLELNSVKKRCVLEDRKENSVQDTYLLAPAPLCANWSEGLSERLWDLVPSSWCLCFPNLFFFWKFFLIFSVSLVPPVVFSFVEGWVEQFYRHDKESPS